MDVAPPLGHCENESIKTSAELALIGSLVAIPGALLIRSSGRDDGEDTGTELRVGPDRYWPERVSPDGLMTDRHCSQAGFDPLPGRYPPAGVGREVHGCCEGRDVRDVVLDRLQSGGRRRADEEPTASGPVPCSMTVWNRWAPRDGGGAETWSLGGRSFEEFGVRGGADEVGGAPRPRRIIDLIDQKEIATDMAFAVMRASAFQSVVPPFGTERGLVSSALSNRAVPLLILASDSAMALRACALGTWWHAVNSGSRLLVAARSAMPRTAGSRTPGRRSAARSSP